MGQHLVIKVAFVFVISLSLLLVEMPTSAQTYPPVVLKRLGRYPVVPSVESTARLRASRRTLLAAAKTIPLTPDEYDALAAELAQPRVLQYGLIPRHLDAMTSGPAPFHALHNVTIPPKQYGWHLTVTHGVHRSDIYIPNACGNVSVVRSIEKAKPPVRRRGTSVKTSPQPSALPPTQAPSPTASPSPAAALTPTPPPRKNKTFLQRYWPVLAGVVVLCLSQTRIGNFRVCSFGGHGSHGSTPAPKPSSSGPPGPPPPPHSPTPKPTTTPIPSPTPTSHPTNTPPPTPPPTPTPHPTITPYPTPTPTSHPTTTPSPSPTPKPTCPPKSSSMRYAASVAHSNSPYWRCGQSVQRFQRAQLPNFLKAIIKGWGALSTPKNWQSIYFQWPF